MKAFGWLFALLVTTPVQIALTLWDAFSIGFVLSKLWDWHAVPLGFHPVAWPRFAAACLALWLMRARPVPQKDERSFDEKFAWFARRPDRAVV